jgi:hypothetical protein
VLALGRQWAISLGTALCKLYGVVKVTGAGENSRIEEGSFSEFLQER